MKKTDMVVLKTIVDYGQDYTSAPRGMTFNHTANVKKGLYMKARLEFVKDLKNAKIMTLRTALTNYGYLIHEGKVTVHLVTITQGDDITAMVKK